jgi:triacylglycerol lipase
MIEHLNTDRWLKKLELDEFPGPEVVSLKYPVLLCHGYGAFASLVKPSPLYDVSLLLRTHNVLAFAPNIVPYAKIETRAESWESVIHELMDKLPYDKINIVAHSMGGLDMRYALSKLDVAEYVESFTTVCTPHHGTSLADLSLRTPEAIRTKLGDFFDWMGEHIYPHKKSDAIASALQLTREYVTEVFNPDVPDISDIPYYSFTAAVGKGTDSPIPVITRFQNNHIYDNEGPNDGIVSVRSAKWGNHIRTVPLSHLEQINLRVKNGRKSQYEQFWLDLVKMLSKQGH